MVLWEPSATRFCTIPPQQMPDDCVFELIALLSFDLVCWLGVFFCSSIFAFCHFSMQHTASTCGDHLFVDRLDLEALMLTSVVVPMLKTKT